VDLSSLITVRPVGLRSEGRHGVFLGLVLLNTYYRGDAEEKAQRIRDELASALRQAPDAAPQDESDDVAAIRAHVSAIRLRTASLWKRNRSLAVDVLNTVADELRVMFLELNGEG
jgi:hypothetical protein